MPRSTAARWRACSRPRSTSALRPRSCASPLGGRLALGPAGGVLETPDFHVFHRYAANHPWTSHAVWLAVARRVYRPDLYREAARALGIPAPETDMKREGIHAGPWLLAGIGGPITMGSDLFCDRRTFDPAEVVAYLAGSQVATAQIDFDALAALNP